MRMGSGNPTFDKDAWRNAMTDHGKKQLDRDVCSQASSEQFVLPPPSVEGNNSTDTNSNRTSSAAVGVVGPQVHCVEPMPATFKGESVCVIDIIYFSTNQHYLFTHTLIVGM